MYRKTYKRRRIGKRRYVTKRRYGRGAKRLRRTIKRVIKASSEPKYSYVPIGTTSFDAVQFRILPLDLSVTQGPDVNQRIGNKICTSRCSLRWIIDMTLGTNPPSANFAIPVRIIIGKYKQAPAAAAASFSDVLDSSAGSNWFFSQINNAVFKAYYDKVFNLGTTGIVNSYMAPSRRAMKFSMPWRKEIGFSGSVDTITTSDYDDKLVFIVCTNVVSSTQYTLNLQGNAKYTYKDI